MKRFWNILTDLPINRGTCPVQQDRNKIAMYHGFKVKHSGAIFLDDGTIATSCEPRALSSKLRAPS